MSTQAESIADATATNITLYGGRELAELFMQTNVFTTRMVTSETTVSKISSFLPLKNTAIIIAQQEEQWWSSHALAAEICLVEK